MSTVTKQSVWPWTGGVTLLPAASHARAVEVYFAVWALVIPIASLVLIPRIPGTIPAYLLAFASPIFCLRRQYFAALVYVGVAWLLFALSSQMSLIYTGSREFLSLNLIEPLDRTPVFRTTMITQSLYLFACVLIFLFVKLHFKRHMIRYVLWGAWFFALYGMYDWCFDLATGVSGDFLNNRTFGQSGGEERAASWSQHIQVGSLRIQRLKGMVEEPSRYGTLAVVYLAFAITERRFWLSLLLLITLFLSTSLTGFIGLTVMLLALYWMNSPVVSGRVLVGLTFVVISGIGFMAMAFPEAFHSVVIERITGQHRSTAIRAGNLVNTLPVYLQFPLINKLFGVGVGTCFLPGSYRVLINWGLVGLIGAITLFAYPLLKLAKSKVDTGIVAALAVLAFIYTFISSALFVPLSWMVLGMAYARASQLQTPRGGVHES